MDVYSLTRGESPLVVSMPHSGTELAYEMIHDDWGKVITDEAYGIPDTDWHIPQLYDFIEPMGASVIRASYSRYVVDLNRDPSGQSLYPGQATTGLVPTTLFDGSPIYCDGMEPDGAEIETRRQEYFEPYHNALAELLADARSRHGYAVLWDAHSIASVVPRLFDGRLPDLNLGTNTGQSCAPEIQNAAEAAMAATSAYETISNGRFKGGWITRHYGQPKHNVHALQMEIAQIAYMTEGAPYTFDVDKAERLRPVLKSIIKAALDAAARLHAGDKP